MEKIPHRWSGRVQPIEIELHVLKLVDKQSGEPLGAFAHLEWKSVTKTGQLEIHKSCGNDFDVMDLPSGFSLFEKARCRERRDPASLAVDTGKRIVGSVT